jgi:hypothetical protein
MVDIPAKRNGKFSADVIAALARRWSGLFSYSAANAVAQLKS